jgi:hypothetical protein
MVARRTGGVEEFAFDPVVDADGAQTAGLCVVIGAPGWLADRSEPVVRAWGWLAGQLEGCEAHALRWETPVLASVGRAFENFIKTQVASTAGMQVGRTALGAAAATLVLPLALISAATVIDNPWTMCGDRARKAGALLAEALVERQHGRRPVVLLGWSHGARLIFACLEALAERGPAGEGLVDSVFLIGAPEMAEPRRWAAARRVVAHRLVNGYSRADWLLPVLHRSTSAAFGALAGLQPVPLDGVENFDVSAGPGPACACPAGLSHRTSVRYSGLLWARDVV